VSARRLLALSLVLLLAPPTWAQTGFEIGARVTVINTKKLKVRSAPNSASTIGTQPGGATGTIVGGTGALVGGLHWWQINYDTGVDGYSPQEFLQVTSSPPRTVSIDSFTAMPTTITAGESATLTWETSNATAVTLNGVPVPADGTLTVAPMATTDYDLLADGVSGRITLTVTQPPPPPPAVTIDSFTAIPTTITAGESATLTWETSNATTVTLNGTTVPADGALTVSPPTTTSYDLLADGVSGRITLTVTQPSPPPPASSIDSFRAVPSTIAVGQSATLTWETSNATTVTLNGATVPADGALAVSPPTTTNYDLLADDVSLRLILTVTPAPPPPPGEQPPGTWTDLGPATKFSTSAAVCGKPGAPAPPACLPEFLPGGGNNQLSSAIDAWVDGDHAPALGLFIVPRGGGHADWAGNQVVGFNPATGGWSLLTPHSTAYPPMSPTGTFPNPLSDGTPPSVHSYGAVAWMGWLNKMWSAGGIYWSPGGASYPRTTWWWDPMHPGLLEAWTQKADRPGGYGTYAVADPTTERVFVRTTDGWYRHDPVADTYTLLFSKASVGNSARALDGVGRKLYGVSAQAGGGTAVQVTDLNNLAAKEVTLLTTGGPALPYGPGLRYDAGRLALFAVGPTATTGAIWSLDPANCGTTGLPSCVWTREVPPDGVHPPKPHVNGTFKRFFAHGCDYFVIVNGTTNVWKYRPSWTTEACEGG
jgi:hypothetical protein